MKNKARTIMFQGTGSDVGKSVFAAAFCRILAQDGYKVAPFKSQNMALNSFITKEGGEIARAQVVQAEAALVEPEVDMNPVLLKPNQDDNSQVIMQGKTQGNMTAKEYFHKQPLALKVIEESLARLRERYEIVVLEGAGSPAEINLRRYDLVNMNIARLAEAPVILIADIDKGGVFASLIGTLELLTPEEREMIKGIIINKFRGDKDRFQTGVKFIEEYTGKPVLGVVPFWEDFKIPEEDSLIRSDLGSSDFEVDIAVIYLPHITNFTDYDPLSFEPKTRVRYIDDICRLGNPDLIIIPGSKNIIGDLGYLYQKKLVGEIRRKSREGVPVIGISGGCQMLGRLIRDPHAEKGGRIIEGIGLLNMETLLLKEKITSQVEVEVISDLSLFKSLKGNNLSGYEIYQGRTKIGSDMIPLLKVKGQKKRINGVIRSDGKVWGTYLHGIFDNNYFCRELINHLRKKKGLSPLKEDYFSLKEERERAYNMLADLVRENIDLDLFYKILF